MRRARGQRRSAFERGFTLLEVLIAVVVLAIVLTVIYRSYWLCSKNVAQAQEQSDFYQSARLALRRLSDDVMCAYAPLGEKDEGGGDKASPPPQDSSDESSDSEGGGATSTKFKGFDGGEGEEARDTLELVTMANLSRGAAAQYEPCDLRYSVEERGADAAALVRTTTTESGESESVDLAPNVKGFDLKFWDADGEEHDSWDGTSGVLPTLVEITLYMGRAKEAPVAFTTAVNLPLAWQRDALGRALATLAAKDKDKSAQKDKAATTPKSPAGQQSTSGGAKSGTTPAPGQPQDAGDEGDEE